MLERCNGCSEEWFKSFTLDSWFKSFREWVTSEQCFLQRDGIESFDKVVDPEVLYVCLREFLQTDRGTNYEDTLVWTEEENVNDRRIKGFNWYIGTKRIDTVADQGVRLL